MKNRKKRFFYKKGLRLNQNKLFFGSFALLFSFVLVVGATLAWTSYAEWTKNHTQSEGTDKRLEVKVEEVFDPNWIPNIETKKEVNIINTGEIDAQIRVSLKEVLLQFKMTYEVYPRAEYAKDSYDYGDLYESEKSSATIEISNSQTWIVGQKYKSLDEKKQEHYYEGRKRIPTSGTTEIGFNGGNRETEMSKWIRINFGPYVQSNQSGGGDYWYYKNGYFYYSTILNPGEKTKTPLLRSLTLSNETPNYFKGSLYDLIVKVEGISKNDSW
ncbi:hypothetical protein IGJ02_001794 [Enterococcus sp. DIV0724b]|uniref:hypothetical protein n=1 Tax=Enterococcus sp. DIV0724b TaxID=2774694 RepID=UPI003D2FBE78